MKQPTSLSTLGLLLAAMVGLAWQQALHAQSIATGQPRGATSPTSAPASGSYTTQRTISGFHAPTNPLATDLTVGNAASTGAPGHGVSTGPTRSKSASPADPPASVPRSPVSHAVGAGAVGGARAMGAAHGAEPTASAARGPASAASAARMP